MGRTVKENLRIGKAFLKYLQETDFYCHITDKEELRDIFRDVYKPFIADRAGYHFASIVYALRTNGYIEIRDGQIEVKKGFCARDQYTTLSQQPHHQVRATQETRTSGLLYHYCADCRVRGNSTKSFQSHLTGKKHLKQISLKYLKDNSSELVKNRKGIEVNSGYDKKDGMIAFSMDKNGTGMVNFTVYNYSNSEMIFLACEMLKAQPAITLSDIDYELSLAHGTKRKFYITVNADAVGILQTPILLAFRPVGKVEIIHILRFLKVEVKSKIAADLPPSKPYKRPSKVSRRPRKGEIVEGVPLPKSRQSELKMRKLKQYSIPDHLRYQINSKNKKEKQSIKSTIQPPLSWDNYTRKFSTLLHIEECQMEVDIRRYDLKGVTMQLTGGGTSHRLRVPGLAENRPSVQMGDHLFARFSSDRASRNSKNIKTYEGCVHKVELEDVVLRFAEEFLGRFIPGMKVDIEFTFNRLTLCRQHFAVEEATNNADMQEVLFPTSAHVGAKPVLCLVPQELREFACTLYDQKLASNAQQIRAVKHILQGTSRPAPYLVFGPPGTGKTVTIVESIKQIYKLLPKSFILACAPSNSAADLIAQRLLTGTGTPVAVTTLFRINAKNRNWEIVDQTLKDKDCCNYNKITRETFFPSKEELMTKRILVTTLSTAGRLASADFPLNHFTHVFIDEAGYAVEPEALIAMANLLNPANPEGGQVVLAGDPKQLGPVLRSPLAIEHGLELSLLERFMTKCEVYERREEKPRYNNQVLTKLLQNYRSHPAILKLPNQMFYENELQVQADKTVRESLCGWTKLPKKNFPILFHGVEGEDEREGQSPSFFNRKEIEIVVEYALDLVNKRGGVHVKKTDIGIISPYRRQVQKIRKVLEKRKLSDIKVGSVEEFQGLERLVILVSTVRSTKPEYIQMDIDYKLGFLQNPKRFNVAMTRAKALLILVGNPYMLQKDENWNMFLKYCLAHKAYTGCFYENEEDDLDKILSRFQKLQIASDLVHEPTTDDDDDLLGVSAITEQHDPEWRNEDS